MSDTNIDQLKLLQNKLGAGAYGNVYLGILNEENVAVKTELKNTNVPLTLFKEYKICRKFYRIKKQLLLLKHLEMANERLNDTKNDVHKSDVHKSDVIMEINKKLNEINKYNDNKIFNYIMSNDLLIKPSEFNINYLCNHECISHTYGYLEGSTSSEHNILILKLFGKNLENLNKEYVLSENCKYMFAYNLLHIMFCIHSSGLIHRDIKPSNIVLSDTNLKNNKICPAIIDFGLGKEYYKFVNNACVKQPVEKINNITGIIKYSCSLYANNYR